MTTKLLNFTTKVDADKSVAEILSILAAHDAYQIQVLYQNRMPSGITFGLTAPNGQTLGFRLPANITAIHQKLVKTQPPRFATFEHAGRVAWRILKDWTEAQMALIETGMVRPEEVFLPYLLTDGEHTLFEVMEKKLFTLPSPA